MNTDNQNAQANNATLNKLERISLETIIENQSFEDCKLESSNNYSVFFDTTELDVSSSDRSFEEFYDALDDLVNDEDEFFDAVDDSNYNEFLINSSPRSFHDIFLNFLSNLCGWLLWYLLSFT